MGLTEEVGKVGTAAVTSMSAQPLAIALLIINVGFLGFAGYVLGEVAANASERNKQQMDLFYETGHRHPRLLPGSKPTNWTFGYPPSDLGFK